VTRRSLGNADAHAALTQALGWLDAAFAGDPDDPRERPNMERLAPHVRAAAEHGDAAGIGVPTASLSVQLADLLRDRVALAEIDRLYRRARAIFARLAQADPGNAGWQRDLAVSHAKLARMPSARQARTQRRWTRCGKAGPSWCA
jgi:hypothetical protein